MHWSSTGCIVEAGMAPEVELWAMLMVATVVVSGVVRLR